MFKSGSTFSKMAKPFRFKQFSITQEHSAMKVGTDAVLLGAWADIKSAKTILDIGTGTGILALMMAQRNSKATIYGIEYDTGAYQDAFKNASNSKWKNRIHILPDDVRNYRSNIKFEAIISNPPFFSTGISSSDIARSKARHNTTLTSKQLINSVVNLLSTKGNFHCILAASEVEQFTNYANKQHLYIYKFVNIRPHLSKPMHRMMMSFSRVNNEIEKSGMVLHNEGEREYSEAYTRLTKDFYLYM